MCMCARIWSGVVHRLNLKASSPHEDEQVRLLFCFLLLSFIILHNIPFPNLCGTVVAAGGIPDKPTAM